MKSVGRFVAACAFPIVLLMGSAADAHVTIAPSTVAAGTYADVVFHVPSERAGVATTRLAVQWPAAFPVANVRPRAQAGWHAVVTKRNGRVDTITWSGGAIPAGSEQQFAVRAGPMPAHGRVLAFRAVQTYADGVAVRWITIREPGQPEPDFPAPLLSTR